MPRLTAAARNPQPRQPKSPGKLKAPRAPSRRFLRAERIYNALSAAYPDARCALEFANPLQLLVATMLSAQSTDKTVNKVTPALFQRYPTARDLADADLRELERLVHATGFFRNKAKNIRNACRILTDRHGGHVPEDMDELLQLPGVARKTANVVLGVAFGRAEGVVVDTHVQRLSRRLDLSHEDRPERIEEDLMRLFPRERWIQLSHLLIHHGRAICDARKPRCGECVVADLCRSADRRL